MARAISSFRIRRLINLLTFLRKKGENGAEISEIMCRCEYNDRRALQEDIRMLRDEYRTEIIFKREKPYRYCLKSEGDFLLSLNLNEQEHYCLSRRAKAILKIAQIEDIVQMERAVQAIPVEAHCKYGNFRAIAQMRFMDILHWLELQKDSNGEVPQKVRELSVFWALVCAKQAGLITTYEEFCEKAQRLINFCGTQFASECTIETVKTAFTKNYYVRTATLIHS